MSDGGRSADDEGGFACEHSRASGLPDRREEEALSGGLRFRVVHCGRYRDESQRDGSGLVEGDVLRDLRSTGRRGGRSDNATRLL